MEAEGTLVLFAELFVAFAGFTGLAGVIRRAGEEQALLSGEIRLLVEYSLIYLVKSVLPLVLFQLGLSEEVSWRLACGAAAATSIFYWAARFRSLQDWTSQAENTRSFWVTLGMDWLFVVLFLTAATQLAPLPGSIPYLLNLLWGLLGTAMSFLRLVKPIWHEVTRGGGA